MYDIPPPTQWALTNIQTISAPFIHPLSPPLFFFCKSSKVLLHAIRFAAIMRTACVSWFQLTAQRPPSIKGGTTPTPCRALFPHRLVPERVFLAAAKNGHGVSPGYLALRTHNNLEASQRSMSARNRSVSLPAPTTRTTECTPHFFAVHVLVFT